MKEGTYPIEGQGNNKKKGLRLAFGLEEKKEDIRAEMYVEMKL